jgi:hypothetical protein
MDMAVPDDEIACPLSILDNETSENQINFN